MDLVLDLSQKSGAPPFVNKPLMEALSDRAPLPPNVVFPDPAFTRARKDENGRSMPQAIAHRGYRARWPENSMRAFREAVAAGTHAIETDVHLSKDEVVVLSHDANLKRCFGVNQKILDREWSYLASLRSIAPPHEPLARMDDLLGYVAEEAGVKGLWILLDIKVDNNADDIMRLMAKTVAAVPPPKGSRWEDHILLGCWAAKFLPLAHKYFPGFSVANIGFSIPYSRQFYRVPHVAFNMLQASLFSPMGRLFLRGARKRQRRVIAWTVNDEDNMDWCIRRGLDGVISDDPARFLDACRNFRPDGKPHYPLALYLRMLRINVFALVFGLLFWVRYGFGLDGEYVIDSTK